MVFCAIVAGCAQNGGSPSTGALPRIADARPALNLRVGGTPELPDAQPAFMPSTWDGIHNFQSFDKYVSYKNQKSDGSRYDLVWGSGNPGNWSLNNASILNTWYLPMTTDGDQTHSLSWWQSFHPDWILYKCDRVTPAWSQGLPQVPLDISNPVTVQWQIQTYAGRAEAGGYNGIAADLVSFDNANHGCGVWVNGVWVQRFTGQDQDPAWTQAVQAWASYAHAYLHGLPAPLILAANHVPADSAPHDANEIALLANIDIDEDEMGFTNYGLSPVSDKIFRNTVFWMRYAQSLGHAFFVVDKWKTGSVTQPELDWSVATYLMGKRSGASLDVVDKHGYGYEYWFTQYAAAIGHPCAAMYSSQGAYFRAYSQGLSVVNTSLTQTLTVTLPQSTYQSIDGSTVTSPVTMPPSSGLALLQTSPNC